MDTIETINKLKEVFAPVAEKIGQGAQYGWEIVLKQQYLEAFVSSIEFLICIPALVVSYFWAKKIIKEDWDAISWVPFSIWTVAWIMLSIFSLETAIAHFLNPEFYAIEFFLNLAY